MVGILSATLRVLKGFKHDKYMKILGWILVRKVIF